jgi:hypothetical protein
MPVYDRFTATLSSPAVRAYVLSGSDSVAVRLLKLHGIAVDRVVRRCAMPAEAFVADSVLVSPRPFQNRREVRVEGAWRPTEARLRVGTFVVRTAQPLGVLAAYLLDPRSDDGLVAWNVGERVVDGRIGDTMARLAGPLPAACTLAPA